MKADTNPFRYCGEYFDEETGFVYLRARYYSPDIGRFVSEDPIKDGNNWYVYCGNNPICFFDNSGYCYYDKNGNWSHDNWEFSGNYVRREDPIKEYIDGNIDEDDKCFQKAMEWWNEHGLYSSISHYGIINNIDYDCFDKEILAFSNYWNHALGISSIDPDVVKSMLVIESNMGNSKSNYKDNDPTKDVMQALDPRNPNISLLSKIGGDPNEGVLYGIPKSGYGAIRNLYSGGTPIMSKVTPMLSICFGTRSLGYFIELRGSVNEGIARYNGYGDKDYLSKVTACMASPATWIRENR